MTQIRVYIIAEDWLARTGLATLLSETAHCNTVGQSANNDQLPQAIDRTGPDVLLVDLGWTPDTAQLKQALEADVPIIALIPGEDETQVINTVLMSSGNYGLLRRDTEPEQLSAAIESVATGLVVIDAELIEAIMQQPSPQAQTLLDPLTPRENDVLQLLALGMTNKAIAQRLDITEHTIKFHVNAIMGKLHAQSRTDAVIRATRLGLVFL